MKKGLLSFVALGAVFLVGAFGCAGVPATDFAYLKGRVDGFDGRLTAVEEKAAQAANASAQALQVAQGAETTAANAIAKANALGAGQGELETRYQGLAGRFEPVEKFAQAHVAADAKRAEARKAAAAKPKGHSVAIEDGDLRLTNPGADALKRAVAEKRPLQAVHIYGPDQKAVDKLWAKFFPAAEAAKLDVGVAGVEKKAFVATSNGKPYTAIEVVFGPVPEKVREAKAPPKL